MVITMVIGLVVVMPDICGCGLDIGVVVWITKPYGALVFGPLLLEARPSSLLAPGSSGV
jgi:hypothetical protein